MAFFPSVGESPGNEVAITVTGLKPDHFYNIRVVAVGPNYFQAGSPVIRLRTFDKEGRPRQGTIGSPPSSINNDQQENLQSQADGSSTALPTVEAATAIEALSAGNQNSNITHRKNRRHSPSITNSEPGGSKKFVIEDQDISLDELNERFEAIRKEIDETLAQYAKDEADAAQQESELKEERDKKRQAVREKEEQTAQLKSQGRTTMEQMRAAEKERNKMMAQLREKEAKKDKIKENIANLGSESDKMKADRQKFDKQKSDLSKKRDSTVKALNKANAELQDKCAQLEAELKDKGKQLQDLKATREKLPGADDEQVKEHDAKLSRDWEVKRKDIHTRLVTELKQAHQLEQQTRSLEEELAYLQQQASAAFMAASVRPPSVDFLANSQTAGRRPSLGTTAAVAASTIPSRPSPTQVMPIDPSYPSPPPFSHAPFAPGLFTDPVDDDEEEVQAEVDFRIAAGPLSPTAQDYLPSNIFDDMDDSEPGEDRYADALDHGAATPDPQSPASSSLSINAFSSPHGSSHNLPYQQPIGLQPTASPASGHRFTNLLSTFQRNRGARNSMDQGPPIGSLKANQSQSFPRVGEVDEPVESKKKINFPWMGRASTGPDGTIGTSSKFSSRRVNPLRHSTGAPFPDADPDSRPSSITSMDLPRPSTDSGSIWGNPGDSGGPKNRLWLGEGRWPSRNGSRRPSLHGSTSALTTTLASADDEILDERDLLDPQTSPSQVGVIGSRVPGPSRSLSQRLNPNAPTFMGQIFRRDKDGERSFGRKDKDRGKEKKRDERPPEGGAPSIEFTPSLDESPSDSRISRDAYSVHTQTSVSESHDSFILDPNTSSDIQSNAGSATKDQENVVRKLFRKGSSSKFSLSSRLGKDSGLFKKGPGSTTNSDRNLSADQRSSIGDIDDLGEDVQFGRSYDSMTSSPVLVPAKSKDSKESRMSSWRFSMRKKGRDGILKEKESIELDRPTDEE